MIEIIYTLSWALLCILWFLVGFEYGEHKGRLEILKQVNKDLKEIFEKRSKGKQKKLK